MKPKRTYFVVNCKKEEKRELKKLADIKGFDTLASYMRHIVRMEIKENEAS